MQEMYKTKVRDVDDLCKRIMQAWNDVDQQIIDSAVREWRKRLRACVEVKRRTVSVQAVNFLHCLLFSYKFHEFHGHFLILDEIITIFPEASFFMPHNVYYRSIGL